MLVLASTSRYRQQLLAEAGIRAEVAAPDVDERSFDGQLAALGPCGLAERIAEAKARSIRLEQPPSDVWILAADQLAVIDDPTTGTQRLLTKPGTRERAVEQLLSMAGGTHRLVNGVVVLHDDRIRTACDVHLVAMEPFGRAEAEAYVERYQPLDCVGSYRVEDDAGLIRSVDGSGDDGVIGLPIGVVRRLLAESGWPDDGVAPPG